MKYSNTSQWGQDAAKKRGYADGGRLERTTSFHKGIDYSDPDKDNNPNNEGSRAELMEAMKYKQMEKGWDSPDRNSGQGPTRLNAQFIRRNK